MTADKIIIYGDIRPARPQRLPRQRSTIYICPNTPRPPRSRPAKTALPYSEQWRW